MPDDLKTARLVAELERHFARQGPLTLNETTKSWVFLTRDEVFKLKKPNRDDLQDLTSLRARHDNTLTEIDLNRRLAPSLYIGPMRVGRRPEGQVALDDPEAATIDWLVHMGRLPDAKMLDTCIIGGMPKAELVRKVDEVGTLLSEFYLRASRSHLKASELLAVQEDQLELARGILLHPNFAPNSARVKGLLDRLNALIREFASSGRGSPAAFLECHGDLRPEHVCLTDPPQIFDCLEFNRTLRLSDPFGEVAFLGMECAMLGVDWVQPRLIERLEQAFGVHADRARLRFQEACHAVVRARLCYAHLLVPEPRTPMKWAPLGDRYLARAEALVR